MENKQNFMGIIIPVVIAVILLTVLPIINSMNIECPTCEECPPCDDITNYNIGDINVNPNFSSGNYIADKGSYDYIDIVTIIKDSNLIADNIKSGVTIFGITGTYEGEVSYTVTLSAEHGGYDGVSSIYIKVDEAPTSNSDYNAMTSGGSKTISYKSGSSASTFEGIKKVYIWGTEYSSYQIDSGNEIEVSYDWTNPTEIILTNNIAILLLTMEDD